MDIETLRRKILKLLDENGAILVVSHGDIYSEELIIDLMVNDEGVIGSTALYD